MQKIRNTQATQNREASYVAVVSHGTGNIFGSFRKLYHCELLNKNVFQELIKICD